MNKTFKFVCKQEPGKGTDGLFPEESVIKATHIFNEDSQWVPILHQFCAFLESTGYVGVLNNVIIKDHFGFYKDGTLFNTINPEEDYEEDDEDEEEEDYDFQEIKREIA